MGIADADFTACETYSAEKNAVNASGFMGSHWAYATLVSEKQDGDRYTVDIRFWADMAYLTEAVTMRYVAEDNNGSYRLISCEKLSGGEYDPMTGST